MDWIFLVFEKRTYSPCSEEKDAMRREKGTKENHSWIEKGRKVAE